MKRKGDLNASMSLWSPSSPNYVDRKKTMQAILTDTNKIQVKSFCAIAVSLSPINGPSALILDGRPPGQELRGHRLHVQLDHILVLQHVVAADGLAVVLLRAPDASIFQTCGEVLVDSAGEVGDCAALG